MTVDEAKKAKDELESVLHDAISQYEKDTGVQVEDVKVKRFETSGSHGQSAFLRDLTVEASL